MEAGAMKRRKDLMFKSLDYNLDHFSVHIMQGLYISTVQWSLVNMVKDTLEKTPSMPREDISP